MVCIITGEINSGKTTGLELVIHNNSGYPSLGKVVFLNE
jgi:hypothetical protein